MEVVFLTEPVDSTTTLLPQLVGDPLEAVNTGLLETLGALAGVNLVTSELPSTVTAELPGILPQSLHDFKVHVLNHSLKKFKQ